MKLVKCENNHYFDLDKYSKCPHCNSPKQPDVSTSRQPLSHVTETHRTQSGGTVAAKTGGHTQQPGEEKEKWKKLSPFRNPFGKKEQVATQPPQPAQQPVGAVSAKTGSFWENDDGGLISRAGEVAVIPKEIEVEVPERMVKAAPQAPEKTTAQSNEETDSPPEKKQPVYTDIAEEVRQKTNYASSISAKTMSLYSKGGVDPVVGWLVCRKGNYYGESFNLKTGQNSIGRDVRMDIPLTEDPEISRIRHCIVIFEPKSHRFFIQQGEGNGITYKNDELVLGARPLAAYDVILIGACEFVFVPYCKDGFLWSSDEKA